MMASPGLAAFDAYVDTRSVTKAAQEALKARGEQLYLDVYRELPDLLERLGDADVAANVGNTDLATRQTLFKGWWAEMRAAGGMIQQDIIDRLEVLSDG
jgi:hypothetical protein